MLSLGMLRQTEGERGRIYAASINTFKDIEAGGFDGGWGRGAESAEGVCTTSTHSAYSLLVPLIHPHTFQ